MATIKEEALSYSSNELQKEMSPQKITIREFGNLSFPAKNISPWKSHDVGGDAVNC